MKLIIEHGHTKRKIEGPFNLCGSHRDLRHLCDILQRVLEEKSEAEPERFKFGYGWIRVTPCVVQDSIINTEPKGWDE